MSEITWTKGQLDAICARDERILVSAAAGSGKTTVLTERIIRRLCDETDPVDLNQMLIVTFTKAATADLKEQISSALHSAIAKDGKNPRLSRQLAFLPSAQISTIHAFCYSLIKSSFTRLNLPASLRIADENEGKQIALSVMDRLLSDLYDGHAKAEGFSLLVDHFVKVDDKDLSEQLLSIFDRLISMPRGLDFLRRSADVYRDEAAKPFLSTVWGNIMAQRMKDAMTFFVSCLSGAVSYLPEDEDAAKKYGQTFSYELDAAKRLLMLLESGDFPAAASLISNYKPPAVGRNTYADPPLCITDALLAHEQMKEYIASLSKGCLFEDETITARSLDKTVNLLEALHRVLTEFDQRFATEKRRRGLLDFSDLERLTLELLTDEDGRPNDFAVTVSARYREIYIDEYQDVNEVQDAIFKAISICCARFTVGDIKQSIYAFRGSAPHIFARDRLDPSYRVIFLSENFRSDDPIIRFSNAIFDLLFRHGDPNMPYEDADSLVCGKSPDKQASYPCELALIPSESEKDEDADEENTTETSPEPIFVADRIKTLVEEEGYAPGDIVILLRSPSTKAIAYEEALKARHIGCVNRDKKSLLENEEILLLLSLLRVIDNPRRDIDLAAVLRSPLYGMDMDDLVRIRTHAPGCLYEALRTYTEETDFEKGHFFFAKLKTYRALAIASGVDKLIWEVLEDTGLAAMRIHQNDAPKSHANLTMFYEYARQFEAGSFRGLSAFIRYMQGIIDSDSGSKFPTPETEKEGSDTVRIMSIHASKGLQFPVTIVAGTGQGVNDRDAYGKLLIDPHAYLAMKLTDDGLAHYDTPFRLAVSAAVKDKTIYEEMRILYVALTRAKQRLIVTAAAAKPDDLLAEAAATARHLPKSCRYPFTKGKPSYLKLMLISLFASGFTDYKLIRPELGASPLSQPNEETHAESEKTAPDPTLLAEIRSRYDFAYPDLFLASVPAKVTVSKLHPSLLDGTQDGADLTVPSASEFRRPRFLSASAPSGAEKGTATHLFMQFCDLCAMQSKTVEEELSRLVDKGFLEKETADLVDKRKLRVFFSSPLYDAMTKAAQLRREIRFNTTFPAAAFVTEVERKNALSEEEILVQGVIDCYFVTESGDVVLLDYKTDFVPDEIRNDPEAADAFLAGRHLNQLRYYKTALERMLCRPVSRILLWSFSLGREVDLTSLCDA